MLKDWSVRMWNKVRAEVREVMWLASLVLGQSLVGVAIAVAFAAAYPALVA
jgi:hypothetical protein